MTEHEMTNATLVGSLRSAAERGVVRMEDCFKTDIDDLWGAITDPHRLARWIAEVDGDLCLGGELHARFTSGWDGPGRVDRCEPPQLLLLTMCPGQAGETVIEATLTAEGDHTRLVIEERGLPLGELGAHGAGWQVHVEDLGAHLCGFASADWHARWTALSRHYLDLAGDVAG